MGLRGGIRAILSEKPAVLRRGEAIFSRRGVPPLPLPVHIYGVCYNVANDKLGVSRAKMWNIHQLTTNSFSSSFSTLYQHILECLINKWKRWMWQVEKRGENSCVQSTDASFAFFFPVDVNGKWKRKLLHFLLFCVFPWSRILERETKKTKLNG